MNRHRGHAATCLCCKHLDYWGGCDSDPGASITCNKAHFPYSMGGAGPCHAWVEFAATCPDFKASDQFIDTDDKFVESFNDEPSQKQDN